MPVAEAPTEALQLHESATALDEGAGAIQGDGTVLLHVIRPGLGRGRGRHLYEADMLKRNAANFAGWRMYVNHLSPEAKKAQGGLPRDVRDLGGRILESWWDPNVPATDRFGAGAVVAKARPTRFIRELIEDDPGIVEASISATATGVKPGEHGGQRCWVVEGIEDVGSVDWVTEAGAGGRVVSLMEAVYGDESEGQLALLASMSDDEFRDHLRAERPDLLEALALPGAEDKPGEGEEEDMPITPEAIQEALQSEDTRKALLEALDLASIIDARVEEQVTERLPHLVEAALEGERDLIRATARADADRRVQIERMRTTAHRMVEESRLPERFKTEIKRTFDLTESGDPTPALNVVDEINDDGEVAKKAEDRLRESVKDEIKRATELVAAANPTRVTGQGPSGGGEGEGEEQNSRSGVAKGSLTESLLQEAGFEDPVGVYDPEAAAKSLQD